MNKDKILEAVNFIQKKISQKPKIGIILGTGIGKFANEIKNKTEIPYETIPHFGISKVESHEGKLIFGKLYDKNILLMSGRFHYYEGHLIQKVVFPIHVMKFLGIETLIITNAVGGMNPNFSKGDLVVINDHINLMGTNPLIGQNDESIGPRFPDMSEPYKKKLISIAKHCALDLKINLQQGVLVSVSGPTMETRSEYRFLRMIGADVVGMSMVPECIVANHMSMNVLGISIVTDECFPDSLKKISLKEVIETANTSVPKLALLLKTILKKIK